MSLKVDQCFGSIAGERERERKRERERERERENTILLQFDRSKTNYHWFRLRMLFVFAGVFN